MKYRKTHYVGDTRIEEVFKGAAGEIITLLDGLGEFTEICDHFGSVETKCLNLTTDGKTAFVKVKCIDCGMVFWQGHLDLTGEDG